MTTDDRGPTHREFQDDDGRWYDVEFEAPVNDPGWWRVTRRDDGKHVSVPFTDDAGIEIEPREVERMALKKFRELGTQTGTRDADPKTTEGDKE